MKKRKFILKSLLLTLAVLTGMSSCTKESYFDEGVTDEQQTSTLTINTRGIGDKENGTAEENAIGSLRAIIYKVNESNGIVIYAEQLANEYYTTNPGTIKIKITKQDQVRVFLIANERSEWGLNSFKSAETIKKQSIEYGDPKKYTTITTPIIMFGESTTISAKADNSTTVSLERNIARVDFYLRAKFSEVTGLSDGTITLKGISIQRMAHTSGLGTPQKGLDLGNDFLTGTELILKEGVNYTTTADGFSLGANGQDYVSFYIPECYITDTKLYTYLYVTGEYKKGNLTTKVAYNVPIGEGITSEKLTNPDKFKPEDLHILRNSIYEMKGVIKSIQQINEVYVDVKAWKEKEVDGSIDTPKPSQLNVSDLYPTLEVATDTTLVQFWSNQTAEKINVLPTGKTKNSNETFNINDIFVSLAKDASTPMPKNIQYNINGGEWGHLLLSFREGKAIIGKTYIITLEAGTLRRTIEIKAVAKQTEATNE